MSKKILRQVGLIICIIFLIVNANTNLYGQYQSIKLRHFGTANGLSQSTIRAITEDSFGFMWFGTTDGLNKYDGNKISVYRYDVQDSLSLASNFINDIFEDARNRLWVSTDGGLCYLDRKLDHFVKIYPDDTHRDLELQKLAEDKANNLWISGTNGVLYKKPKENDQFEAYVNPDNSTRIQSFIILKNGLFWVSYENAQLFEFNPSTGIFTLILKPEQEIFTIFEDNQSLVWMGTNGAGLIIYDQKNDHWESIKNIPGNNSSLPSNIIRYITKGENAELLISTNNGLVVLSKNQWKKGQQNFKIIYHDSSDPSSICSNFLSQIYKGKDQVYWIGSIDSGLSIWDRNAQQFNHINQVPSDPQSLNSNVIWNFEEDKKGNLWIGTSKGLNYFDIQTGHVQHYIHEALNENSLPDNRVWQIIKSSNDHFWIGTTGSLTSIKIDPKGKPSFQNHYPSKESNYTFGSVRQLLLDHKKNLWVGTGNGLYIFDPIKKNYHGYLHDPKNKNSISGNNIRYIFEDSKKNLWIGTRTGLNLYDESTGHFIRYDYDSNDSTSINDNTIRCIIEDKRGRIWIGTGRGLNEMIPGTTSEHDKTFKSLTIKDGLPNETIYAMEVDDEGFIWASTNNGLTKFDPESKTFFNYNTHQGLQSHEFNSSASLKMSNGKLLFGGINGFNYFDPREIAKTRNNYPIVLTGFKANYHEVIPGTRRLSSHINIAEEIKLEYANDKMFYFEFSALDLLNAATRKYAYRLLPYEKEWNEAGKANYASYTNIAPGEYTFQVRSSDLNGNWSEENGEIAVYIQPAFWQTIWFRLLIVFLTLALIYSAYRYRIRSIYQTQIQLEKTVKTRTNEIAQQKIALEETLNELKKTQTKLVESEKMASLGLLTAGVAHEINNPVNFVNTSTEALELDIKDLLTLLNKIREVKEDPSEEKINQLTQYVDQINIQTLGSEMQELIENIKYGGDRISKIIQGLKSFSYKSGKDFLKEDLSEMLEAALLILSKKLNDKSIKVIKDFPELPPLACHSGKLNQVFVNIVDNAIDAMDKNGALKIRTYQRDKKAVIEFTDNGNGMDELTLKKVFDPFFTTKAIGKGTGLGMAITYGIIKDHDGQIEVDSVVNEGTTIRIILPFDVRLH